MANRLTAKTVAEEATLLMRDLLIGVTSFFRDPSAFEALSDLVLKPLLAASSQVRIWTPGCGTGQEAYSPAMLLTEALDGRDAKLDIQIFATDIDEKALNFARRGIYSRSVANDVAPHRQERFFTPQGHRLQTSKDLRKLLVFSPHNLISDPPLSRLDLISCRNLLIYLGRQTDAHFSMREEKQPEPLPAHFRGGV